MDLKAKALKDRTRAKNKKAQSALLLPAARFRFHLATLSGWKLGLIMGTSLYPLKSIYSEAIVWVCLIYRQPNQAVTSFVDENRVLRAENFVVAIRTSSLYVNIHLIFGIRFELRAWQVTAAVKLFNW